MRNGFQRDPSRQRNRASQLPGGPGRRFPDGEPALQQRRALRNDAARWRRRFLVLLHYQLLHYQRPTGCGTIFSVSTTGTEKVRYSFTGGPDGAFPNGGLVDVNGTMYGMAEQGGAGCGSGGCGTIFSLNKSGAFQAIYSFQGPPTDGAFPWGNLTNVKGVLYGTTDQGGASTACSTASRTPGCGTVFRVTTSGKERMLYSFEGSPDGNYANMSLLYLKGVLYGTTLLGGSGSCARTAGTGCGTVFSLSGF